MSETTGDPDVAPMGFKTLEVVEQRKTLQNDEGFLSTTDLYEWPGVLPWKRGKFFPSGARGYIERVDIWGRAVVAGPPDCTVHLGFAIAPGTPELFEIDYNMTDNPIPMIQEINVARFWEYDSIFIYVKYAAGTSWVAVAGDEFIEPYDTWITPDTLEEWTPTNSRISLRIIYAGKSIGEGPVVGNFREIPEVMNITDHNAVALTLAANWYSYTIPSWVHTLKFQCRENNDIKYNWKGAGEPYWTLKARGKIFLEFAKPKYEDNLGSLLEEKIYFQGSIDTLNVEIEVWGG